MLKRRVKRQRQDINFLNVTRTPIPFPKAHVTSPNAQETTPGTTTTYSAERIRVRLSEAEAEGAAPVQKTRTTSSARALIEQICREVDKDCESPTQIRRIAEADYEKNIAEARRIHLEKLTKVKDGAIAKVISRTDADIRSRMNRWMVICPDPLENTKAETDIVWHSIDLDFEKSQTSEESQTNEKSQITSTKQKYTNCTNDIKFVLRNLRSLKGLKNLKGHVAAIEYYSEVFFQSSPNP